MTSVKVVSLAVESPGQNLEGKHSDEHLTLATELEVEKKRWEARAEAKASKAIDVADELMQKLEEMHNISDEPSVTDQMLYAELKTKVKDHHLEILELKQLLQMETELRVQTEADTFMAVKVAEALCKEVEHKQRVLEVSKRCSDNKKSIEDVANRYMAEKKEKDGLQQEIVELLKKQNILTHQNETAKNWQLKRVPEHHLAIRQNTIAIRLEMEEKKEKVLFLDILWLIQMLKKEMELRQKLTTEVGEVN